MASEKLTAKVVDFTNVKDGGGTFNKRRVAAGDYLARVTKAEDAPAKGDGVHQYLFTVKLVKFNDRAFPYYCKLQENQLWKLRNLFIAAGIQVPKKRMKIDPSKVVGKLIGVTMEDDEYEGKLQSNISSVFPAAELSEDGVSDDDLPDDDEGDEDEDIQDELSEDTAEEEEYEEEAEEEDEADELDGMDRNALKVYIKERNPEFRFLKSLSDDDLRDSARDLRGDAAVEDEEEDEEEEEPAPPPRKKAAAKKTAPRKAATVDDDELEELDISDL